jgi:hypothetical protein
VGPERHGVQVVGIPPGCEFLGPSWNWGLAGPEGWEALWSGAVALRAYGMGTWWASCSFSRLWHGEAFHDLGVQCAILLALPGALSQLSVSPVSQQGP